MHRLTEQQVDRIARELAGRLAGGETRFGGPQVHAPSIDRGPVVAAEPESAPPPEGDGVFASLDDCIAASRAAFRALSGMTLAKRDEILEAIREAMRREGEALARHAWQETGLGRVEDKIVKNRLVTEKTPGTEALRPETTTGDHGLTLTELAPFGVIGAITPTTNPTSTIICNTIGMLAAGNSVVFNVHPGAAACSMATVRHLNRAIVSAGGPPNLVAAVAQPTIESATALMHHPDIDLLVVTGGPGVVKAAMKSGKRAVCAGPGNPPVVVDETADLAQAGRDIVRGASFDNNVCVDEKQVFVVATVADELIEHMKANGAYRVSSDELRRIEDLIFTELPRRRTHGSIDKRWVGKNADRILAEIGVRVGPEVRLVLADVPEDHPLVWSEQLMPVLPLVRVPDVNRAIDLAVESEHGFRHSASMHSRNIDNLSRMARRINTSIFVKNGPIVAGLGAGGEGYTSFTISSPTGEGLTTAANFSRRRRCVMVDHFRIV